MASKLAILFSHRPKPDAPECKDAMQCYGTLEDPDDSGEDRVKTRRTSLQAEIARPDQLSCHAD